jgi:beta-N-acetylhexosaminidase
MDIERQAGLLLLVGFEQSQFDPDLEALLGEVQPGGVIFFQRNVAGLEEFARLVHEVAEYMRAFVPREADPVLAVDAEGGTVDRFRHVLTPLPSARAIADTGDDLFARNFGALVGEVLASFRLNLNLAPVVDLATPQSEQVMAGRVVSSDPQQVLRFARNFLAGMNRFGIFGCAKHFPGLGSAPLDTHMEMPQVSKTAEQLWEEDLLPFRELHDDLLLMMVNHAWYPALHGEGAVPRPASLSREIVTGLLRERIGFRGVVAADDLEMGGVLAGRSIGEAAVAAVEAGCDLLPVCRVAANVREVYKALVERARQDEAFAARIEESARRIEVLRQALRQTAERPSKPDWKQLAIEIHNANDAAEHMAGLSAAAPRFSANAARPRRESRPPGGGGGRPRGRGPRREREGQPRGRGGAYRDRHTAGGERHEDQRRGPRGPRRHGPKAEE